MTTINNSELIEKVGGIEKAREIVNGAPDEASFYQMTGDQVGYILDGGGIHWWWNSQDNSWNKDYSDVRTMQSLNDLRTAIAEYSPDSFGWVGVHYKLGDHIVYKKPWVGNNLVLKIGGDGNQSISLASASLRQNYIRHATPEEIKAGHRIDLKQCQHGYDIACLICGFGNENGVRVWRKKIESDEVTDIRNHVSPSTVVKDLEAERHG